MNVTSKAFTFVELLLALFIFSVGLLGFTELQVKNTRQANINTQTLMAIASARTLRHTLVHLKAAKYTTTIREWQKSTTLAHPSWRVLVDKQHAKISIAFLNQHINYPLGF